MATTYISQERFGVEFEDRINKLLNVDPYETPLMSMVKKGEAERNRVDWQTETLDAASSTNEAVEGSTVTWAAGDYTAPASMFNYCQLSRKPFAASFSIDQMMKPGLGKGKLSTFNNEKIKKMRSLKKDMESSLVSNNNRVQPLTQSSQSGRLRGAQFWITTNVVSAGAVKYGGTAFSQGMWNDAAQLAVDQGGKPDVVFMNSFNRIKTNEFVARPQRDIDSMGRKLVDVVDKIVSIAGTQDIVFDRWLTPSVVLMLEMQYWEQRWLLAPQSYVAGLTGSKTEGWVEAEHTLIAWAEKTSAKITGTATA